MGEAYTTDLLIAGVQRRGSIPVGQTTFTDSGLLAMGDDELGSILFPMLMNLHAEYFVDSTDSTLV